MTPRRHRIADLHCHYPMHVLADRSAEAVADRRCCAGRWFWLDGLRAFVFNLAARLMNFSSWSASWRVDLVGLRRAQTGLVLSVLYDPAFEIFVVPRRQRPRKGAFEALICQLDCVESEFGRVDPGGENHCVVMTEAELDDALATGRTAFVHCVEGGFHLGVDPNEIIANVATLAQRGVAYITLAHLWYRGIATNAPALPGWSDSRYHAIFHQHGKGLSPLGKAAITAMYEHKVLIDIAHMDRDALADTFGLLDRLDGHSADPADYPVIASHNGIRFKDQEYMLSRDTIETIAARGGVVGLILARHQLYDGVSTAEQLFEAVRRHVDTMYATTGCHDYTCIGSDLDGFIRPIKGIDGAADLAGVASWFYGEYPADVADAILFGNVERVVRKALAPG